MTNLRRPRTVAAFAGLALIALAGSWVESSAKTRKPSPPPPPPAASVVVLPRSVIQEAAAYSAYMSRTAAISPVFGDGPSIARSLNLGAAYEPDHLVRGAIAYGAIVALQDPAFVASFRAFKSPAQRQEVAYAILRDPYYVTAFQGSASAAGAIVNAVGGQGQALFDQGKLVKQSAYDVQRSSWSKAEVFDRPGRLQATKTASTAPPAADVAETARLQQAVLTSGQSPSTALTPAAAAPPYRSLVIRSLAAAGLAALGHGGEANIDQMSALMVDPGGSTCLRMSKLNLYQCLAVSRPHYEDVFCLGEHVMMDTGRCLMKTAGAVMPIEPKTTYVATNARPYKPVAKRTPVKKAPVRKK